MASSFITCSHCGKTEDLEIFRTTQSLLVSAMRREQLCFDCAYWKAWMANPEPETIIVNRRLYKLSEPLKQVNRKQARAKSLTFLLEVNTKNVLVGNNLIFRGTIPCAFQSELPDQFKLITQDEYLRIYGYGGDKCLSKGCFDRYHCIWYRPDIAEPIEPWNTIPDNYEIGSELCPSFVNKIRIYDNN